MGARRGLVFNIGPHVKTDASRAATYSKRKKGLLKKVKELSILCGVDVAVMCYHPQMTAAPPLLWGQPNLDSVLNRYKGVALEEREKRKLDNSTFLHNQVLKVASDLHHLMDNNRKYLDHLENSLWDDRLNSCSPADLQQLADQVLRKKKEVMEFLASSTASHQLIQQEYHNLPLDVPVSHIRAAPSPFTLQNAHNEQVVVPTGSHNVLMQPLMWRMPMFPQSNVVGATVPIAALCMTPPCPSAPAAEPAESESSIISGPNSDPDTPGSTSSFANLTDHHSMFVTSPKALGAVELLEDDFGLIDTAPTWYINGVATTPTMSNASETFNSHTDAGANSHVKVPAFSTDIFDIWSDNMGFPPASGYLQQCQPSQNLPEPMILLPHVN